MVPFLYSETFACSDYYKNVKLCGKRFQQKFYSSKADAQRCL